MAGPWFTVRENDDHWEHIDTIWISNGEDHFRARVEIQVELDEVSE